MKTRLGRVGIAVALALALVGCQSGGEAALTKGRPAPTVPTDPGVGTRPRGAVADVTKPACSVLTEQDVSSSLGNAVRPPRGDGKFCQWATAVDRGTSASITIDRPEQCEVRRSALDKEGRTESVGGLGGQAVWNWRQVAILLQGDIVVCWPDSVVWVAVSGEKDQAELRNAAATVAQKAHNKL